MADKHARFVDRARLLFVAIGLAGLGVGCSSSGPTGGTGSAGSAAGGDGSGTAGGGAAGAGGTAGGASGSASDADGGPCVDSPGFTGRERCPAATPGGYVRIDQQIFQISSSPNTAFCGLQVDLERPPPMTGSSCTTQSFGSCVVHTCKLPPAPGPTADAAVPVLLSAGVITVSSDGHSLSGTPDSMPPYLAAVNEPFFSDGARVDFTATGGDVPAFEDHVCGPPRVVFTQPAVGSGAFTIDRSQDFTIRWTNGGATGFLNVSITEGSATTPPIEVECDWDPSLGQGVIPTQALMKLPSDPQGFNAVLIVRKPVSAAGTCVELTAANMTAPLTP